jgi:hypothetical protein
MVNSVAINLGVMQDTPCVPSFAGGGCLGCPHLDWSDTEAVSNLVERLYQLERVKRNGQPNKWAKMIRKRFVNGLLDAAHHAGGDLGINCRNGRGSLVEAVELLQPLLPKLFQDGLSPSTLKTIKTGWLKTRKK